MRPLAPFYSLIALDCTGSTSDEAKRLAALDAPAGTLVWAREQTEGHGRLGRTWISPPGNLYFSLLLRPVCPPGEATQLTFVAAVAVAEAVAAVLPAARKVTCKWPNDVLVGGRKTAGILLESGVDGKGGTEFLIIGIGVNIASHPPDHLVQYPATSLCAEGAGVELTVDSMLERFCQVFQRYHADWRENGFAPVRAAWLERAEKLNQPIEVRDGSAPMRGIFADLDEAGALVLLQGSVRRTILAGDVFPIGV